MFNVLFKLIFSLITKLFDILLKPLTTLIFSFFPDLSSMFCHVNTYLSYAFQYVRLATNLLLIPSDALSMFFDYIAICTTIYYATLAVKFSIRTYKKYKP